MPLNSDFLPAHPEQWRVVLAGSPAQAQPDLVDKLNVLGFTVVQPRDVDEAVRSCKTGKTILIAAAQWLVEQATRIAAERPAPCADFPLAHVCVALIDGDNFRVQIKVRQLGAHLLLDAPLEVDRLITDLAGLAWMPRNPYHVLLVDDDMSALAVHGEMLRAAGFDVLAMDDPVAAYEFMAEYAPDVCVLDVEMPACRGTDLAALMRREVAFSRLPVIYLSAFADVVHQLDARHAGGEGYLTKPVDARLLVAAVLGQCRHYRLFETSRQQLKQANAALCFQCPTKSPSTCSNCDMSQHYRAEQALLESRNLLRTVIDESPSIFLMKDWEGRFLLANTALAKLYGTTPENLVGKGDEDFNPNVEQVAFFLENIQAVMRSGLTQVVQEDSTDAATGMVRHFQSIKKPLIGPDGSHRILVIATDITEIRSAQARAEESEKRLVYAMAATGEGVWDWDLSSNRVKHNAQWCQLLGMDEMKLDHPIEVFATLLHPEDRERVELSIQRCLKDEHLYTSEHRMVRPDGKLLWVEDRGHVVERDAQGRPLRMVGSVRDISQRRALEAELRVHHEHLEELVSDRTLQFEAARDEAQRLARVKSEFLANMSHEIRTPLNAILGFAKIGMREEKQGLKVHATSRRILESGEHLLEVINDILDYSRLESDRMGVDIHPFRLAAVVENTVEFLVDRADSKGLLLHVSIDHAVPEWVSGDSLRLRQILLNLLANAVKFTEHGTASLAVMPQDGLIVFQVTDTGVGMTQDQLTRLFKPFEQADSSITRKYGGSGLGLAISNKLAKMLGGDIKVTSVPEQGSVFTLDLPLFAVAPPHAPSHEANDEWVKVDESRGQRLAGLQLLAAEDVEVNRIILEAILQQEGAQVVFAEQGNQVLQYLHESGADAFDAILMDVQMPEMDGYEATRCIRALGLAIPIIGLTAHAMAEERNKCLAAGMVDHVSKPIDENILVAALLRHIDIDRVRQRLLAPAPVHSLIDWVALNHRYEGNRIFINKIIATVLKTHVDMPAKLRVAAQTGDWKNLVSIPHKLKSLGGNLEVVSLQSLAIEVEAAALNEHHEAIAMAEKLANLLVQVLHELATRSPL